MGSQQFVKTAVSVGMETSLSKEQLNNFILSKIANGEEDPFYVVDLGLVKSLISKWNCKFPNIKPFYAVKCNPEPTFLAALAMHGAGFDCASKREIEAVLSLGVSPGRIIFANTCKPNSHIKYAASVGVNLATYDSVCEVEKMKKWHPQSSLVLRIHVGDVGYARYPLATKFGALPEEIVPLLEAASATGLPVVGVSFHVGSVVTNPEAYRIAIASAKAVFDTALQLGMPRMHILDIGGGFVADTTHFDNVSLVIKDALTSCFGHNELACPGGLQIISEPGRFFADKSFTLVTNITGKRVRGESREYWINDGIYGSMNIMLHEPTRIPGYPLKCGRDNPTFQGEVTYSSIVYGPTCDSKDTIWKDCPLPDLQVSDWLVFTEMGAYAASTGSKFNGFDTSAIHTYVGVVTSPLL
ncbi:ornithine decarboxylase [Ranunculus cassubicifolius]